MRIDDKLANIEIGKNLPPTASDSKEKVEREKLPGDQNTVSNNQSEQDTIVELSSSLKEAKLINEVSAAEPDIREEKVAALKEQVDSGTYKVDAKAVADKLVDAHLDDIF
jgi:negative regulator of flagellin synthesis FlgM